MPVSYRHLKPSLKQVIRDHDATMIRDVLGNKQSADLVETLSDLPASEQALVLRSLRSAVANRWRCWHQGAICSTG